MNKGRATIASLIGIVALVVSACGSSTSKPTSTGNGYDFTYTYQKPAKTGGTVVFGDWQAPDSAQAFSNVLDPTVVNGEVLSANWDSCVVQLPDLTLKLNGWKPSLCSEVPTLANGDESADGTSTTIKIDPKAKWSDGQGIVADDMILWVNLLQDPNEGGAFAPWDKAKATKVDDHTVKIDWGQPYAPYLLSIPGFTPSHAYPGVLDSATGKYDTVAAQAMVASDAFLNTPVSDGAYKVESFSPDAVVFVPNSNYFSNFFHQAALDKLIFRQAGTKDVLIQAYKAGQYDHVEDFTPADLPKFNGVDPKELISSPAFLFEHVELNQRSEAPNAANTSDKKSIFTDVKIRQAFIGSFNKGTAIAAVLGVKADDPSYFTNEFTASVDPAFDTSAPYSAYNPAAAAKTLDDAGYKVDENGIRTYPGTTNEVNIKLVTTFGNSVRNSWIALMQQQWQGNLQIAVTLDPDKKIFSGFTAGGLLTTGAFDAALFAFSSSGDGDSVTTTTQSDQIPSVTLQAGQNYSGVADPKVDDFLAKGRVELDYNKRVQIYHDMYLYIAQQAYYAPMYVRPNQSLTKTTLGNYKQQATSAGNTWNAPDWFTTASSS